MKLWPSDLNCDNMLRSSRRQVLLWLTLTVGVVRGQEWLKEQEPAHRTDYLNTLEIEALARNHNSDSETRSPSGGVSGDQGDLAFFHEFHGNSSHTDHFKLLKEDGSSVLVGARNVIYNLSLPNLLEFTEEVSQIYTWRRPPTTHPIFEPTFIINLPTTHPITKHLWQHHQLATFLI